MKTKTIAALMFGSLLATFPVASFADNDHDRRGHDRGYSKYEQRDRDDDRGRDYRRDHGRDHSRWQADNRRDWRYQDDRRDWRGYNDRRPQVMVVSDQRYGARPYHNWRRGEYLPSSYRHQQYYVRDWRSYRLQEPPRGYRWVNVNGDYLLVSIVSNVIAQILVGR